MFILCRQAIYTPTILLIRRSIFCRLGDRGKCIMLADSAGALPRPTSVYKIDIKGRGD